MAKEGALLVSKETVKKVRGKKQQQEPEGTAMPDIPAAAPKRKAVRKAKSVNAAIGKVAEAAVMAVPIKVEDGAAAPIAEAVPKRRAVRKAKSTKAAIGEAAAAAVMAVPVKGEEGVAVAEAKAAEVEAAPKKRAPRRKEAPAAAADAAAAEDEGSKARASYYLPWSLAPACDCWMPMLVMQRPSSHSIFIHASSTSSASLAVLQICGHATSKNFLWRIRPELHLGPPGGAW